MSRKLRISIGTVVFVFAIFWISQFFYFDTLTRQVSLQGVGPLFTGHQSENLQAVVTRPFVLRAGEKDITIQPEQLGSWIESYHRPFTGKTEFRVAQTQITEDLADFAPGMDVRPVNARFAVASGSMIEVVPATPGKKFDVETSRQNIVQALVHNQSSAELAVINVVPEFTLEKLRAMGITALLGEGTSKFTGSPAHRIHNIRVGAERFTDIIIAPGASFSFVNHLGDVDATTGYLPELVIKSGKVIPEYGGGLCQVSTTLFRATIYAGLPILERRPHSFPVHYYNPQGFDATIYPGAADLRFVNNTPGPILIQSRVEGTMITFAMFGASDGRTVTLDGPHQYDVQPDGSMKAIFYRTITWPNGPPASETSTEHKDTFASNYKSPALFEVIKNPYQ